MNLQNPPEIADGGYWYVLPLDPNPDEPGQSPLVEGATLTGWCAWYGEVGGTIYCALRTPGAVSGLQTVEGVSAAEVLAAAGYEVKPRGRIGGV